MRGAPYRHCVAEVAYEVFRQHEDIHEVEEAISLGRGVSGGRDSRETVPH
jgi:hypothetical protein